MIEQFRKALREYLDSPVRFPPMRLRPPLTCDDSSAIDARRARFYEAAKLGEKQAVTPEGFLVCYDVPLARTGIMWYAESELIGEDDEPLISGVDGKVQITREEDEVFRKEHVDSYVGKPVVNDHPPVEITPENWKLYATGTVIATRRGTGMQSDLLLGDIVVCEPSAIADVRSGKREVSCGYDAKYDETGPGKGRQHTMIGNHVALVDSGRCGPRCSIGDRKTTGDSDMRTLDHRTVDDASGSNKAKVQDWFKRFTDGLKEAMKKGGDALEKYLGDASNSPEAMLMRDEGGGPGGENELHLHLGGGGEKDRRMTDEEIIKRFEEFGTGMKSIGDMVAGIAEKVGYKPGEKGQTDQLGEEAKKAEGALKEEAPAGTGDAAIKAGTKDSALLEDAWREALSLGEVLVPGIRPSTTFDRAMEAKKTLDALCGFRRTTLDLAYHQPEGRAMIDQLVGGKPLDLAAMPCGEIRTLFRSAAAMRKTANDAMLRARGGEGERDPSRGGPAKAPRTGAELNALHAKCYGYAK